MTYNEEKAFHEKWIKGITLKMIWGALIIVLSMLVAVGSAVWYISGFLNGIENKIENYHKEDKQFTKDQISTLRTEMNAKFDTIRINQIQLNYNTKLDIQNIKYNRPHPALTEVKKDNKLIFIPFSTQR